VNVSFGDGICGREQVRTRQYGQLIGSFILCNGKEE
jgi:hypothetical protein